LIGVLSLLIAAIMLSVGNEVEKPSSGITGEEQLSVTTEAEIPDYLPIQSGEMESILSRIKDSIQDADSLMANSSEKSRNALLKEMIKKNVQAVGLVHQYPDGRSLSEEDVDARVRAARAILQTVIDKWHQDAPVSSALMKEEIIFEQPLDFGGFDQQSFNRSKSLQEIVSSKQFNENLKIFLDMTDGSEEGSDIHVVKTGEEIGDDFSDEVNPYYQKNPEKLKEDIARLQDLQETLVNLTRTLDKGGYNDTIIKQLSVADLEILDRVWDKEIQGRKEFGYPQIGAELEREEIKVHLETDPGVEKMNWAEQKNLTLSAHQNDLYSKIRELEALKRLNLGRNSDGSISGKNLVLEPRDCKGEGFEHRCDDQQSCYHATQWCNRIIDCPDNSDEKSCPCRKYLEVENIKKICDGYNDCPNGEDEVGCDCPQESFDCKEYSQEMSMPICVSREVVCDQVPDCPGGRDEKYCYELSTQPLKPDVASQPKSSGLVHVRTSRGWKVLSLEIAPGQDLKRTGEKTQEFVQELAHDVCRDSLAMMSFDSEPTVEVTRNSIPDLKEVARLRINFDAQEGRSLLREIAGDSIERRIYEIQPPLEDAVFLRVDCGQPQCGMPSDRFADQTLDQTFPFSVSGRQLPAADPAVDVEDTDYGESVNNQEVGPFGQLDQRIVGGSASSFGQWPFIVGITRDGRFVCGGTIVDENWVLTAAHCVNEDSSKNFQDENYHFQVLAGLLRRGSSSSLEQVRVVEDVIVHSNFNSTWYLNDIALLKVDRPFDFNYAVSPICMPDDSYCSTSSLPAPFSTIQSPVVGDNCVAAGWGQEFERGPQSDELQQVELPIKESCVRSYNNITSQVCAGFEEGGQDACRGDSGGPLFCEHRDGPGRWFLGGIISHGEGCARAMKDGVFVRVCQYRDWVDQSLSNFAAGGGSTLERTLASTSPSKTRSNTECKTFTCDGGKCLHLSEICNIEVNCYDGRDEQFCYIKDGRRLLDPSKVYPEGEAPTTTTQAPTGPTTVSVAADSASTTTKPDGSIHPIPHGQKVCKEGFFQCRKIFQCVEEKSAGNGSIRCDAKNDCMDMTDELECTCREYLMANPWTAENYICDGHPDCPNWTDEMGCHYCDQEIQETGQSHFYCRVSGQCIPSTSVCDTKHDCRMREDERYCLNVANGEVVQIGIDSRPIQNTKGLLALNTHGTWKPVCAEGWDSHINDRVCRYIGRRESEAFELINRSHRPHLALGPLQVSYASSTKPVFPRSIPGDEWAGADAFMDKPSAVDFEELEVLGDFLQSYEERASHQLRLNRTKRQLREGQDSCSYIHTECSTYPTCGVMPLYNFLGDETPDFGPGVFPWTANLYLGGPKAADNADGAKPLCGATLVHQDWVLIGEGCALQLSPPTDWVVARLGGYRETPFLSGTEETRRIVQITQLPGTKVYLGRFDKPVALSEYINVICIPKVQWVPTNMRCVLTGSTPTTLNQFQEVTISGRCKDSSRFSKEFDLCAEEYEPTTCMEGWGGALACPDATGKYHAVGLYHTDNGGCDGAEPPMRFTPLVTSAVRKGIETLIKTADHGPGPYSDLADTECSPADGKHRCPLGMCIDSSHMCNGVPDCADASDETLELCGSRGPIKCDHVNATHCVCPSTGDVLCQNEVCITTKQFCDGVDDCGDGSDEPEGCDKCDVALEHGVGMATDKICDGQVDCRGSLHDLAFDESAERCCGDDPTKDYRCVLGTPTLTYEAGSPPDPNVAVTDQCIESRLVCDGDPDGVDHCANGADESSCLAISATGDIKKDAFGRIQNQASGILYNVLHGRAFVWCDPFLPFLTHGPTKKLIGDVFCKKVGYPGLAGDESNVDDMITTMVPTIKQTLVGIELSEKQQELFDNCQTVHLTCQKTPYQA